jgi:beta-glucosidase-like glycosyl hydrolase
VSDWSGTRSTVAAANGGLDIEMPNGYFFGEALEEAIAQGSVAEAVLDDKVLRILTSMFAVGIFDRPQVRGRWRGVERVCTCVKAAVCMRMCMCMCMCE